MALSLAVQALASWRHCSGDSYERFLIEGLSWSHTLGLLLRTLIHLLTELCIRCHSSFFRDKLHQIYKTCSPLLALLDVICLLTPSVDQVLRQLHGDASERSGIVHQVTSLDGILAGHQQNGEPVQGITVFTLDLPLILDSV